MFYKTLCDIKNAVDWNMVLCGLVQVHQKIAPCMVTTVGISKLSHFVKDIIIKFAHDIFILY